MLTKKILSHASLSYIQARALRARNSFKERPKPRDMTTQNFRGSNTNRVWVRRTFRALFHGSQSLVTKTGPVGLAQKPNTHLSRLASVQSLLQQKQGLRKRVIKKGGHTHGNKELVLCTAFLKSMSHRASTEGAGEQKIGNIK